MNKTIMAAAFGLGILAYFPAQAEHKRDDIFPWSLNHNIEGYFSDIKYSLSQRMDSKTFTEKFGCSLIDASVDYSLLFEGLVTSQNKTITVYYESNGPTVDKCVKERLKNNEKFYDSFLKKTEHEGLYRIVKQSHEIQVGTI